MVGRWTQITEVTGAFRTVRHHRIEVGRYALAPPFLRPEEESLLLVLVVNARNIHRPANGVAEIILLVGRIFLSRRETPYP